MQNTIEQSVKVSEDQIRQGAYHAWENEGRPTGQDLQFWLDAEARLGAAQKEAADKPKARITAPVAQASPAESKPNVVAKAAIVGAGRKQAGLPGSRPKTAKA